MSLFNDRPLKPESEEDTKLAETPNGMRVLMDRYSRHDGLTANIFRAAQYNGLSGEDKYVMLSYNALIQLEHFRNAALRQLELSPPPPILMKTEACEADKKDAARYRYLRSHFSYDGVQKHRFDWYLPRSYNKGTTLAEDFDNSVDEAIARKS